MSHATEPTLNGEHNRLQCLEATRDRLFRAQQTFLSRYNGVYRRSCTLVDDLYAIKAPLKDDHVQIAFPIPQRQSLRVLFVTCSKLVHVDWPGLLVMIGESSDSDLLAAGCSVLASWDEILDCVRVYRLLCRDTVLEWTGWVCMTLHNMYQAMRLANRQVLGSNGGC